MPRSTKPAIKDEKRLPWRESAVFLFRIASKHPLLLASTVLLSFGVAGMEVLSLGLIVPFLESLRGSSGGSLAGGTPLAFLVPYFEGMSTEEKIRTIAVSLVGIQVVKSGFSYIQQRVSGYMQILIERDLRRIIFDELLRVEIRFIHKEKVANLFTILHSYPRHCAQIAREYFMGLPKAVTFVTYVALMLTLSWELTLLAIVLGVFSTWAIGHLTTLVRRLGKRINDSRVRLHQVSLESLHAMKVIRLFAREDYASGRFNREVLDLQRKQFKKASINSAAGPLYSILNVSLFALLLVVATYTLSRSADAWVLLLTMFILVFFRLMGPAANYTKRRTRIAGRLPSLEAVMEFLDRPDKKPLPDGDAPFTGFREGVRFEGVGFRYDADGDDVIRDVTFQIPKGRMVALVGGSGAGKSTLINLLARLYDPTVGRVTVDGRDLRGFRSGTWRSRLAVVSQDTVLFNDTVRENIRFGRLDATDEEIETAARQANAHDFILEMEDGYDTLVGDRGVRLSGGQAQRVAIARAILADPDILVLDEATSALDTATERLVQQAIEAVSRDRTVVAVAHRLSTVRQANEILVLEQGRIVERGTHEALLEKRGAYWSYVQMQSLEHDEPQMTRVPVDVPEPARVVLAPDQCAATVRLGGVTHADVPILTANGAASPREVLAKATGDAVVVRAGDEMALVRCAGEVHENAALYVRNGSGDNEVRVRVRHVRPEGITE